MTFEIQANRSKAASNQGLTTEWQFRKIIDNHIWWHTAAMHRISEIAKGIKIPICHHGMTTVFQARKRSPLPPTFPRSKLESPKLPASLIGITLEEWYIINAATILQSMMDIAVAGRALKRSVDSSERRW